MKKVKIGLLPLYVKLYDDGAPGMRPRIEAFAKEIFDLLNAKDDVEVITSDICRLESEFSDAVTYFENEDVDSIVTLHLAYSPSLESEKVLKNTKLPIVVLDTTPNYAFTDDEDTAAISYNHGIHGVQDMCNLLVRNGKEFFVEAGHYIESDVIERVVQRVKGIKAAKNFRNAKVGSIGGEFAGMGDFAVSGDVYKEIGIETVTMTSDEAKEYVSQISDRDVEALKAEVLYLNDNVNELMQKVIYIEPNYKYVVFDFIKGSVMHDVVDVEDLLNKIVSIVSNYKETFLDGFGYMDELNNSWEEFLLLEIENSSNAKEYISDEYVKKCITNLRKYPFTKTLIHGDFGTHNFICKDNKLVGIIDPMTVIGDPLYDLLFAIVSNVDILNKLTLEDIYLICNDNKEKTHDLLIVLLYARISRCLKYHPEDISIYIDFYHKSSHGLLYNNHGLSPFLTLSHQYHRQPLVFLCYIP